MSYFNPDELPVEYEEYSTDPEDFEDYLVSISI